MVSRRPNVEAGAVTRLSAPILFPTSMTWTAKAGAGVGVGAAASTGGAGASFFLHAGTPITTRPRPAAHMLLRDRIMMALLGPSGLGNLEGLARVNEIGVLDDVLVGFVDAPPLAGAAVVLLGDLGKCIALHYGMGACRGWSRR